MRAEEGWWTEDRESVYVGICPYGIVLYIFVHLNSSSEHTYYHLFFRTILAQKRIQLQINFPCFRIKINY